MAWATRYLEAAGIRPTHMLTLTLPPRVWERVIASEGRDEAVARYRRALTRFMDALRHKLKRGGYSGSWFWWVEFQRRGAPHVHLLLDLGGKLTREAWAEWAEWLTRAWAGAYEEDPAVFRASTRIEALRFGDLRYARAYALKTKQKEFPFSARWGRSWGVAGPWARALREAVREDHAASSRYTLDAVRAAAALATWMERLPPERGALVARALLPGAEESEGVPLPWGTLWWYGWGEEEQAALVEAWDTS
jgi:hypothetical protein